MQTHIHMPYYAFASGLQLLYSRLEHTSLEYNYQRPDANAITNLAHLYRNILLQRQVLNNCLLRFFNCNFYLCRYRDGLVQGRGAVVHAMTTNTYSSGSVANNQSFPTTQTTSDAPRGMSKLPTSYSTRNRYYPLWMIDAVSSNYNIILRTSKADQKLQTGVRECHLGSPLRFASATEINGSSPVTLALYRVALAQLCPPGPGHCAIRGRGSSSARSLARSLGVSVRAARNAHQVRARFRCRASKV